ncbi:MAG TPA: Hsp70 family protein [Kofleriaceae bacterium]
MARVFICYRRSESQWAAGRLYDRLSEVIGRDNLFFDVSDIEPGEDFVSRIREIVAQCDVLLAIVGPNWASIKDSAGRPRLQNPRDLVRIEVAAALQRKIRVIPILVDGAVMPDEDVLPQEIAGLAARNAHDVSFARFHSDVDSFVRVLQRILAGPGAPAHLAPTPLEPLKSEARPAPPVTERMPFTISLTTLGDVATPLISKGSRLPAQASEIFSTAADNQTSVEISLLLGQHKSAGDNMPIGKFNLQNIPAAPRGVPQIEVTTSVDSSLILTVTAEDLASNRKEVLDALDLTRLNVPPEMLQDAAMPETPPSARDSRLNAGDVPDLGDLFKTFFGSTPPSPDIRMGVTLTAAAAASGVQQTVDLPNGKRIAVRIPAGIQDGQQLRIRGKGNPKKGGGAGNLYIIVSVTK